MLQLFAASAAQVALAAVLLGAGLPVLFALGVRSTILAGPGTDASAPQQPRPLLRVLGILCYVLVLCAVAVGLTVIIATGFGKEVSFEHIIPMLVDKQ